METKGNSNKQNIQDTQDIRDEKVGISIDYGGKVSIYTIIFFLATFASIVSAAAWIQYDVDRLKHDQQRDNEFRYEVRNEYITRQQLEDIVIDRFDRFEENLINRIDRMEKDINNRQ